VKQLVFDSTPETPQAAVPANTCQTTLTRRIHHSLTRRALQPTRHPLPHWPKRLSSGTTWLQTENPNHLLGLPATVRQGDSGLCHSTRVVESDLLQLQISRKPQHILHCCWLRTAITQEHTPRANPPTHAPQHLATPNSISQAIPEPWNPRSPPQILCERQSPACNHTLLNRN